MNFEKYQRTLRRIFVRELGFKIPYEDCVSPTFYIILAAFEPLTGVYTAFENKFKPLMKDEFNMSTAQLRTAIAKFHDDLYKALRNTSAFQEFLNASTLQLFAALNKRLNVEELLRETEQIQKDIRSRRSLQLKELVKALPKEDTDNNIKKRSVSQETGDDFAANLSWKHQYNFDNIDYELSSFLMDHKELYLPENDKKYFVYADLQSANFNALRLLNPELVLNATSWDDLAAR